VLGKRSQTDSFVPAEMSGAVTVLPGVELPGVAAIMVAAAPPVVEVTPWGIDAPSAYTNFGPPTSAPLALTSNVVSLPAPHSAPLMATAMPMPMGVRLAEDPSPNPTSSTTTSRSRLYVLLGAMLVAAGGAAYYALAILPSVSS